MEIMNFANIISFIIKADSILAIKFPRKL